MMKKILVVDDEENIRFILDDLLNTDYAVSVAANGREALALIDKTVFDLIITDLVMPEMNGIELVIAVKNKTPSQKIIAMSGGGGITGRFDYLPVVQLLGADKIFAKPFDLHEVLAAVKGILGK
jgi:DNA-binding response OmpR family regulator